MGTKLLDLLNYSLELCDGISKSIINENIEMISVLNLIDILAQITNEVDKRNIEHYNIDELNEKLSFLLNALEDSDMELFSDNLSYELRPLLEYWKEGI